MTRIRKNWSSSRGTEEPERVSSQIAAARDFQMLDTAGMPVLPPALQLADDDAIQMLAAVSLEHNPTTPHLKRENSFAKVIPTGSMDAQEREQDSGWKNAKHERASPRAWERSYVKGNGSMRQRQKSDNWYQKLSPLWPSDRGPASLANGSKGETGDEEQSKSSSVAENEMVDSDLCAREQAKQNLAAVEPVKGLISNILESHCVEREPANEETSRVLQELVTGKKRRQKPWATAAGGDNSEADQKIQELPSAVGCSFGDANRRRLKSYRVLQKPVTSEKHQRHRRSRAGKAGDGDGDVVALNATDGSDGADATEDDSVDDQDSAEEDRDTDNALLDEKKPATKSRRVATNGGERKDQSSKSGRLKDEVQDKSHSASRDVNRKRRARSQGVGSDEGERKKLRAKPVKSDGDMQGVARSEDIFPKGWKYKGLAQIAERDEVPSGQTKKLCGRTDGHNWRCPLRVVEGLSLCQHHLNKARAKKLGRTSQQKKQVDKKASEPLLETPQPPESSAHKQAIVTDQHGPTKFRRRHKTAKLSGL